MHTCIYCTFSGMWGRGEYKYIFYLKKNISNCDCFMVFFLFCRFSNLFMYTCSIGYKIAEGQNEIFIEKKKIGKNIGPSRKNIGYWVRIMELINRLQPLLGFKIKVVERCGKSLQSILIKQSVTGS